MEVRQGIREGQLATAGDRPRTLAEQVYALAAEITNSDNLARLQLKIAISPFATNSALRALSQVTKIEGEPLYCCSRVVRNTLTTLPP